MVQAVNVRQTRKQFLEDDFAVMRSWYYRNS